MFYTGHILMIKIFKKSIKKENLCVGLTESNDCKAISELRQLQKELEETEHKIKKLQHISQIDLVEFMKFFLSDELRYVSYDLKLSHDEALSIMDIEYIMSAFRHIDDFDKFIDEVRVMYDREHLIKEQETKTAILRNEIAAIKNTLGIK